MPASPVPNDHAQRQRWADSVLRLACSQLVTHAATKDAEEGEIEAAEEVDADAEKKE